MRRDPDTVVRRVAPPIEAHVVASEYGASAFAVVDGGPAKVDRHTAPGDHESVPHAADDRASGCLRAIDHLAVRVSIGLKP